MDDHDIERTVPRFFQEISECGPLADGIDVGRFALLTIDPDRIPFAV